MSTLHHSPAARSDVVVRYLPDELQVEVVDDGVSTEDGDASQETAGLLAVRDEVAALGGTLDAGPRRGPWLLGPGAVPLRARLALSQQRWALHRQAVRR